MIYIHGNRKSHDFNTYIFLILLPPLNTYIYSNDTLLLANGMYFYCVYLWLVTRIVESIGGKMSGVHIVFEVHVIEKSFISVGSYLTSRFSAKFVIFELSSYS